jgi:hypothetical protein
MTRFLPVVENNGLISKHQLALVQVLQNITDASNCIKDKRELLKTSNTFL